MVGCGPADGLMGLLAGGLLLVLFLSAGGTGRRPGWAEGEGIAKLSLEAVLVCAEAGVLHAKLTIFIAKAFVRLSLELRVLLTKSFVFVLDALDCKSKPPTRRGFLLLRFSELALALKTPILKNLLCSPSLFRA